MSERASAEGLQASAKAATEDHCCSPVSPCTGVPCSALGFKVVREPRRGAYGGAVDAEIAEALRIRRKVGGERARLNGIPDQETVPAEAYSTLCPLEYCCGIKVDTLPGGDVPLVVSTFGNAADAATNASRKQENTAVDEPVCSGSSLGFRSFEESGWKHRQEPRAFRMLQTDDEAKEHFIFACKTLGLSCVRRDGEDADRMVLRLPKDDVPGSVLEVKDRIRKIMAIDHVNVLRLIEACEDDHHVYLIYDSLEGFGCIGLRVLKRQAPLDQAEVAKLGQQLAAASAVCHRSNIFHLDMSLWHIVSGTHTAVFPMKVFGFGLAGYLHAGRIGDMHESVYLSRGPFYYTPPELARVRLDTAILQPLRKVDKNAYAAMDMWSIGVCMYTCISTHYPFGGGNLRQICTNIIDKRLSFDASFAVIEPAGVTLIEQMLEKDYRLRPRAADIIGTGWITTHVRAVENQDYIVTVVERMKEYSMMKPGMRALAKVIRQGLRLDKLRALEGLFHDLDVRGDGELEPHELGAYFVNRTHELRTMFKMMDLNNDGGISLNEFVLSNVFGKEVLTERMLMRTFEFLDLDGTGEITGTELFSALKKVDPGLRPEHVGELMGDCDRDWDADIDFTEFRSFFPQVASSSAAVEDRWKYALDLQEVVEETFDRFRDDCVQWRSDVNEQYTKVKKARQMAEKDSRNHKSDTWMRELIAATKKSTVYLKTPPRPSLPTLPLCEKLHEEEEARKLASAKLRRRGQLAEDAEEEHPGGPLHMDAFFRECRPGWSAKLAEAARQAKAANSIRNKQRKRQDALQVFDEMENLLKRCGKLCEDYVNEQWDLIEAAKPEGGLPAAPVPRRGLAISETDEADQAAAAEISAFMQERQAELEGERRREENRVETMKLLYSSEVGGELRGYSWLEKQLAKAEKQGKAPPAAAVTLKQITAQLSKGVAAKAKPQPPSTAAAACPAAVAADVADADDRDVGAVTSEAAEAPPAAAMSSGLLTTEARRDSIRSSRSKDQSVVFEDVAKAVTALDTAEGL